MAEIGNFYPIPIGAPVDPTQQRPQGRQQQQDDPSQRPQAANRAVGGKAPLNVLPSDEALERLITRAQDAQNQGQTLERGSILNLVI